MGAAISLRFTTAQRKMLRSMFRVARGDDESWVDDIRRSTVRVDEYYIQYMIKYCAVFKRKEMTPCYTVLVGHRRKSSTLLSY
eukprot:5339868-Pyramimonas_sp.AAC.1